MGAFHGARQCDSLQASQIQVRLLCEPHEPALVSALVPAAMAVVDHVLARLNLLVVQAKVMQDTASQENMVDLLPRVAEGFEALQYVPPALHNSEALLNDLPAGGVPELKSQNDNCPNPNFSPNPKF